MEVVGTPVRHSLPLEHFKEQNIQEVIKLIVQGFCEVVDRKGPGLSIFSTTLFPLSLQAISEITTIRLSGALTIWFSGTLNFLIRFRLYIPDPISAQQVTMNKL